MRNTNYHQRPRSVKELLQCNSPISSSEGTKVTCASADVSAVPMCGHFSMTNCAPLCMTASDGRRVLEEVPEKKQACET